MKMVQVLVQPAASQPPFIPGKPVDNQQLVNLRDNQRS
jgi:hypothetical protein